MKQNQFLILIIISLFQTISSHSYGNFGYNLKKNRFLNKRNRVWMPRHTNYRYLYGQPRRSWGFKTASPSHWRWVVNPEETVQPHGQYFRKLHRNPTYVYGRERIIPSGELQVPKQENHQTYDSATLARIQRLNQDIQTATNGQVKYENRSNNTSGVWNEIQTLSTQPNFAENIQKWVARRKKQRDELYSRSKQYSMDTAGNDPKRVETIRKFEQGLQKQIYPDIQDIKKMVTYTVKPTQNHRIPTVEDIWYKHDDEFKQLSQKKSDLDHSNLVGEKVTVSNITTKVPAYKLLKSTQNWLQSKIVQPRINLNHVVTLGLNKSNNWGWAKNVMTQNVGNSLYN